MFSTRRYLTSVRADHLHRDVIRQANKLSRRVSLNVPGAAVVSLLEKASDRLCGNICLISAQAISPLCHRAKLLCAVCFPLNLDGFMISRSVSNLKCVLGASDGCVIVTVRVCMLHLPLSFDGSTLLIHIQPFKGH